MTKANEVYIDQTQTAFFVGFVKYYNTSGKKKKENLLQNDGS